MVYKLNNPTLFFDGAKSILLEQYPDEAWTFYEGAPDTLAQEYYKFIPTLYRAVDLRAGAVSSMPFRILRGETEIDSSASWENAVGFLANPFNLLKLVEMSLSMAGRAYLWNERSKLATKRYRYILPTGVEPRLSEAEGLIGWRRKSRDYPVEDVVYFWQADPYVEIGPPLHYPSQAAANACGVLLNVDSFASQYFKRGAIKAMLLKVTGMPLQSDREKLESWWSQVVAGIKNAFGAKVINADKVEPVIVGDGMKELENQTLTKDKQEEIAVAMGIPMSILYANAANYATAKQDELNFLTKTIIPECDFIQSVLNEQIFERLGMYFEFLPDTLDAMQEDERQRSDALVKLVSVLNDPIFEIAADILGYELDDETWEKLRVLWAERKQRAEQVQQQMQPKPETDAGVKPEPETDGEENEQEQEEDARNFERVKSDLEKWKVKSLKRLREGESAAVTFSSDFIPTWRNAEIIASLGNCATAEDVRAVFAMANNGKRGEPSIADLISALKDATDALRNTA